MIMEPTENDPWNPEESLGEFTREEAWLRALDEALKIAEAFAEAGYHKQIVNRLLEPFSHINVVVTATDWNNFFKLRRHPDAEPHIRELADAIFEAMKWSVPRPMFNGDWHLPYVTGADWSQVDQTLTKKYDPDAAGSHIPSEKDCRDANLKAIQILRKVSTARCARVSYYTHEGYETAIEEDLALHDKLVGSSPIHASPAEHQATPPMDFSKYFLGADISQLEGNLSGWIQYRKILEHSI